MENKDSKSFIDRIIQNRVLSHVLFWMVLVVVNFFVSSLNMEDVRPMMYSLIFLLPIQLGAAYLLAYWQVPELLMKKRYLLFVLSLVASIFVFSVLGRLMIIYVSEPFWRENFSQESVWEVMSDIQYLLIAYFPATHIFPLVFLTAKSIKYRFEERHQFEILKKEKATAELNLLKAQIHPHFLFNTLNNLYALTLEKSDAAPEVVIKLSRLLDYMLYQCSDPTIAISKEVDLIGNYIDLELLRYGDKLNFSFNKNIDDPNTPVAPMILLSIIENAFKHGVSGNITDPVIEIDLKVVDNKINFKVFNTKTESQRVIRASSEKGMGSENVKKQLDLIYPGRHGMVVEETDRTYALSLWIEVG